jgi:1,4-dihydroxy-6-naphthoate synthase
MEKVLSIGFSPCPNDTFIFYALINNKLKDEGLSFKEKIEDVETLNHMAMRGELDVTKISFHAFGYVRDEYVCLRSGAALGKRCGPLIVVKGENIKDPRKLKGKRIAIPGGLTTANLLLMLYETEFARNTVPMVFSDIMEAVKTGNCDAGLVIHEGRFTYKTYGLVSLLDLGEWWEEETGLPIPLGGIIGKREIGKDVLLKVERLIKESILYSTSNPEDCAAYIKKYAQEMDENVLRSHISLYVNDFTLDMGKEGERAIGELFSRAEKAGILKPSSAPLFLS